MVNLFGVGTSWLSSSPTFSISTVTDTAKNAQNVLTDTTATLTISTGVTAGVVTVTDSSTAANYNLNITSVSKIPVPGYGTSDWRRRKALGDW